MKRDDNQYSKQGQASITGLILVLIFCILILSSWSSLLSQHNEFLVKKDYYLCTHKILKSRAAAYFAIMIINASIAAALGMIFSVVLAGKGYALLENAKKAQELVRASYYGSIISYKPCRKHKLAFTLAAKKLFPFKEGALLKRHANWFPVEKRKKEFKIWSLEREYPFFLKVRQTSSLLDVLSARPKHKVTHKEVPPWLRPSFLEF